MEEIDIFTPITLSTVDSEEQKNARLMLKDLDKFSRDTINEYFLSTWETQFIDDLIIQDEDKVFSEKQLENIDRLHTKYLVDEDF
jgi:hypothetical protein